MTTSLVYSPRMTEYELPHGHPLRPERFSLAVELIEAWGLLGEGAGTTLLEPAPAGFADLLLFHSAPYVEHVTAAGAGMGGGDLRFGTGEGDTPAFPGMHEASALIVGGTCLALESVIDGRARRSFAPAGGLHHAQRGRASGFCIYNDCAVAIAKATIEHPGLRVAYVDIDAHHGDGVQAAFYDRPDVLTVSVHESGQYLFPGTGSTRETGEGAGEGFALNVPLPPHAGDDAFARVLERAVLPALRAFRPDVIVAQVGGDAHRDDPLTHLDLSVAGYVDCVRMLVSAADELCEGRIAATGGGGYQPFSAVPRMWASAFAVLADLPVPETLPASWREAASAASGGATPVGVRTFDDHASTVDPALALDVAQQVERVIGAVRAASADGGVVAL